MNLIIFLIDAKRLIGRNFDQKCVQDDLQHWPFKVIELDGKIMIEVICNGKMMRFYPEQVSAMVLYEMKKTAEARLGRSVSKAVITVPANFTDSQRHATKQAGEIAGLEVLRIINEPTAAALATGLDDISPDGRTVLIFDLGGGTFDVSILFICEGVFEVKATKGDLHLGGEDFDNRLVQYCVNEYKTWTSEDLQSKNHLSMLKIACEQAKRTLSTASVAKISLKSFYKGLDFECELTRAYFEELNADLFKKTIDVMEMAMEEGSFRKEDIDDIVMVGGSSRIPKVRKMVQDFFQGKKLHSVADPDEAVAYGAARHAAKLGGETSDDVQGVCLVDVTPFSLGVKVVGGIMSVIIDNNTRIPVKVSRNYTTLMIFKNPLNSTYWKVNARWPRTTIC